MPVSKVMTTIGQGCYELRIHDNQQNTNWRIVYRIDDDAIIIAHWFKKTTRTTSKKDINLCKARLAQYDTDSR